MKQKRALTTALLLALSGQAGNALAVKPAHPTKKHVAAHANNHAAGIMPCQVSIDSKEDREIVILKLTQRLDCLENKVNYLSEQLSLQSKGTTRSFNDKSGDFVIRYPSETDDP